jgi:uncharacterized protein YdeI (YjbR/CyaY-like superfamily)
LFFLQRSGKIVEETMAKATAPEKRKLLHVISARDWRDWLQKHYKTEKEIWLVYYRKNTGKPRIAYNQAVEEALCFGWIDSRVMRVDEERFAQRFSVRNPKTPYSQANRERLRKLIDQGKVAKDVLTMIGDIGEKKFVFPADILNAIKTNKEAWKNYRGLSDPYKRIRIGFIEGARNRPLEFKKRLEYFIRMTEKNKRFGFGGIEKYY